MTTPPANSVPGPPTATDIPADWLHNDDDTSWPEMVAAPLDASEIPDTEPDHWDV